LYKGKKITTVEELIEFLDKVDESILATDLEKVGIEALFKTLKSQIIILKKSHYS